MFINPFFWFNSMKAGLNSTCFLFIWTAILFISSILDILKVFECSCHIERRIESHYFLFTLTAILFISSITDIFILKVFECSWHIERRIESHVFLVHINCNFVYFIHNRYIHIERIWMFMAYWTQDWIPRISCSRELQYYLFWS